jgi:hypothetical protein
VPLKEPVDVIALAIGCTVGSLIPTTEPVEDVAHVTGVVASAYELVTSTPLWLRANVNEAFEIGTDVVGEVRMPVIVPLPLSWLASKRRRIGRIRNHFFNVSLLGGIN